MLDVIRKHASSWETRIIFGIIILVFIFFFGYSSIERGRQRRGVVADVNGEPIPYSMFQLAFDNTYQFYRQIYKDDMPKEIIRQIQVSALQQLIRNKLLEQLGKSLGLAASRDELIDAIRKSPVVTRKGTFDPEYYRNVFLPQFQRRYGINFEEMMASEITVRKTEDFLSGAARVSFDEASEIFEEQNTKWTFEKIEINPLELVEGGKLSNADEASKIAEEILERMKSSKGLRSLLKRYGLKKVKTGPITLRERHQLFSDAASQRDFIDVFSLTKKEPFTKSPLHIGSRIYIIKLTNMDRPASGKFEKEKESFIKDTVQRKRQLLMQQWLAHLISKAEIKNYLDSEG